jgi:hypothetical protein
VTGAIKAWPELRHALAHLYCALDGALDLVQPLVDSGALELVREDLDAVRAVLFFDDEERLAPLELRPDASAIVGEAPREDSTGAPVCSVCGASFERHDSLEGFEVSYLHRCGAASETARLLELARVAEEVCTQEPGEPAADWLLRLGGILRMGGLLRSPATD